MSIPHGVEKAFPKEFPVSKSQSGNSAMCNPGNPLIVTLQFETAFDLDQDADTLSTDNLLIPGTGKYAVEGLTVKASEAFAFTTLEPIVCLVPAGGTPSTGAIAAFSFATGTAIGSMGVGTYAPSSTDADPINVISAGTAYELGIVQRPTGGIVTGQIKQAIFLLRPIRNANT